VGYSVADNMGLSSFV